MVVDILVRFGQCLRCSFAAEIINPEADTETEVNANRSHPLGVATVPQNILVSTYI